MQQHHKWRLNVISITSVSYDPIGYVVFEQSAQDSDSEISRRTSVTSTLDGGVTIFDGGFTDSGRVLQITDRSPTLARRQAVERLLKLYPLVNVANDEGVFLASPNSIRFSGDQLTIRLNVKEKLA